MPRFHLEIALWKKEVVQLIFGQRLSQTMNDLTHINYNLGEEND